jgi:hypothetical protein
MLKTRALEIVAIAIPCAAVSKPLRKSAEERGCED